MRLTVTVTDAHIAAAAGTREDGGLCPVARAIAEVIGSDVWVSLYYVSTPHWHVRGPAAVLAFVTSFDQGLPVRPFEFELDVPAPAK